MSHSLTRVIDGWVFYGDFFDCTPMKPKGKFNEISIIRGASRYQNLGVAGSSAKFGLRFYDTSQYVSFMSKIDSEYVYTDETGSYNGVFKDDPDVKKTASDSRAIFEVTCTFTTRQRVGGGDA